jgi:L-rhamnose mutarotase
LRIASHTKLLPDAVDADTAAHREVPADLVAAIRAAGAREWAIWRSGLDPFHVLARDNYAQLLAALEPPPVNISCQARMAYLPAVTHDYSGAGAGAGLPMVWHLPPAAGANELQ